ncbi:hypothetical protein GCM10009535_13930 [Streptomyces thermocarboxydovorans]|uniref:Uncharacterized protein n=1 Tax=Streptomyces thermocarboxydovorans TaxID=59298 RepID=A0ABN1HCT4_9ACTN
MWPMPAEASTTTESVVTARIAQRGLRRAGGRAARCGGCGRRCGAGRGRGERGGVDKGEHLRTTAVRGIVSTVGRYDLRPGISPPARAEVSPVRGNVMPL